MSVGLRSKAGLEGRPMELLAHAFDRSPVPKLVLSLAPDDYGTFTAINDAFCELVGYTRDQLLGQPCSILLDVDRLGPVTALFEAMIRGEMSVMSMERILIRRDGSRVWIVSQNVLVHDRDGRPFLFVEIVQSSGREALADSEARFRTLVDSSPIGMAVLDTDGAWVRANPAVAAMLGYTGAELAALNLTDVTHPEDRESCASMLHDMASGARQAFQDDFRYVGKNGHLLWCRLTVTPLTSESGAPLQLLAQLADVSTERHNRERLVAAERITAREAERLRTTIAVQREIGAVATDRDALVRMIADCALQVLPSGDSAHVRLLNVETGMLESIAGSGRPQPPVPVTESLAGLAITSGGTIRCDDTGNDPRVNPKVRKATGSGAVVIAPLRAPGSGAFGVLTVASVQPNAFDDGDERQLTLLADAAGNALRHAEDTALRQDLLRRTTAAVQALERERAATLIAMARLERSERQFAEVADNSPIARIVLGLRGDERGRIVLANPAFCLLFGYTQAQVSGMHLLALTGGEQSEEFERNLDIMASGERTRGAREIVVQRSDGTPLTVAAHTSVITDEQGPATAVVQLRDVTAERAADEATEREVRRLRATVAVQREVTEAATSREAAVHVVAARAVDLFPAADGAAVELVEGDQLVYVATAGTLSAYTGTRIPRGGSLSGIALDTGSPAHCADAADDPRVNRAMCERLGIGSMLVAPLHADKAVIGVLKVSAGEAYVFDDTDEQQLALLADSLSAALRHADDATRNTEALRALEVSEQRFRLTFDNSPLGLTLCSLRDQDFGRYLQANPAMTAITGWSQDELNRMTFADLTHPDDVASTREFAARLIDREIDTVTLERRYRHRDGHTIWVSVRVAVVTDGQDRARYVVNQVEDITAAREADAHLRRTARLFELIPAAVIVRDLDGTIRWWNDGATRLYGWPLAAASGKSAHRLLHTTFPYGGDCADQEETLRRDGYWNGQLDHITADGRTVNVLSRQVLHRLDLENAQVLEVNADQTAARAAELALAESTERLRAQFSNTAVAQVISALDGTMISANPAYGAMLGRPVLELIGMSTRELTHPDDRLAGQQRIAGLFVGDSDSYTTESRLRHADGHWVPVEATISMVRDAEGHPKLLVGVITDITARRAAEHARDAATAALEERNTELEAANQLKLDIIGMLGHEIGNPLTSIRGNAEILTDDWQALTDERRARAIDAIARQAGTLDEIVQEVLAMVTIESGKIRADRRSVDLHEEIGRALWATDAVRVPVSGPAARVLCHPGHLQQILVNLLSNARKYGGGATAVRVTTTASHAEVAVEDDGPGVPEEFRDRLFERLARADRDATSVKGTGLGLYIVRGLAQANHGDIRHEPSPSGGSRFIISLESPGPDRG